MRIAGRCERSDLYSASVALYSLEEVRSVTEDCNTAPHDRPRWLVSLVILLALAFGSGCDKKSNPASPGPQPTPQTRIVFASGRDGNVEIYIMNADGTDQKRLTNDPIYDISPAWLPGGRQVLYVKDWGAGHSLHRMNDDGTNDVLIDSVPGLYISGAPRVSPDGSLILCSRGTPAIKPHIWLMNLDATDGHYLTEGQVEEGDPDWSPDGTRIVFSRNIPSSGWTIYTMNADGSDTLNVGGAGVGQGHPRWSPDGTQIVYTQAGSSIYVMAPDGSGRRRVKPVQGGADWEPSWSPDGKSIVYTTDLQSGSDIFVTGLDGLVTTNVTNSPGLDNSPDWGPVGVSNAFARVAIQEDIRSQYGRISQEAPCFVNGSSRSPRSSSSSCPRSR